MSTAVCPWCGPHEHGLQSNTGARPVCPTCGLDEAEVRYAEKIMKLGGAEVYRQEYQAEQTRKQFSGGRR